MIPTPVAKVATRSRLRAWLDQMRNDPSRQYGLQQAGIEMLQGDTMNDPWGALAKGIAGYAVGRRQSEEKQRVLGIEAEERARRQAKEDAQMAQQSEQFALNKRLTEAQLAAEAEKRARSEQERARLGEMWETLSEEDKVILAPLRDDPDKFYSVFGQRQDDRRQEKQFETTFGETQRRNRVDERNDSARIGLEKERNQISREGLELRTKDKNTFITRNGMINTVDPGGRVLSSVPVPQNPAEIKKEVLRLVATGQYDAESAMALIDSLDAKLGVKRESADSSLDEPPSDAEILQEVEERRSEGFSDAEILSSLPAGAQARVRALMGTRYALPGR